MNHRNSIKIRRGIVRTLPLLLGALLGIGAARLLPSAAGTAVPPWLLLPFVLMLGAIAVMPLFHAHTWERNYHHIAFFLGSFTVAALLCRWPVEAPQAISHAALEYGQFIAMVGGLFVVSGGIFINLRPRGQPWWNNTLLLAGGALLANLVGTTGAAMLLVRPFLRLNHGRIRPFHIVFFIMVVANCGGCLTPMGDPPLFLGYLKGVPFSWTLTHLWHHWLFVNAALLTAFWLLDRRTPAARGPERQETAASPRRKNHAPPMLRISGWGSVLCLALLVAALGLDAPLKRLTGIPGIPWGAAVQVAIAAVAIRIAHPGLLRRNQFLFTPVKEVAILFAGIFATMIPALLWLQNQSIASIPVSKEFLFYFGCGSLSSLLDNAPTYLCFLQAGFSLSGLELAPANLPAFLAMPLVYSGPVPLTGTRLLELVSTSAVFFGAMTYIGNGPNFMVKAIADASGIRTPSFLGYLGYSLLILLPILMLHFWLF